MMTQGDMLVRAARMKLMAEYEEGRRQADMRQRVEQEVAASHPVNGYNGDLFSSHGPNPDLESIRQLRAGDKPLEDPWIDPVSAGAGGFGGSLLRNLLASKVPQALGRSAASGIMGAAADYPIGAATEHIGEKVPGAALPFNVLAGMGSGLALERMGEQLLTNPRAALKPLMNETGSLFGGMGAKPALIADSPKPIASAVDWDLPVKDEVYGKLLAYADELKPERELKGLASAQSRERFIRNIEGFRKNQSSGEELYTFLTEFEAPGWNGHNEKGASKLLARYGIDGIRFGQGIDAKYSAFELANQGGVDDIGSMKQKNDMSPEISGGENPIKNSVVQEPVFHGSSVKVDQLSPGKDGGIHFGSKPQAEMRNSKEVYSAHLDIKKPKRYRDTGGDWKSKIAAAKKAGYDGIVYLNRYEGIDQEKYFKLLGEGWTGEKLDSLSDAEFKKLLPGMGDSYIVFSPEQVKPLRGSKGEK